MEGKRAHAAARTSPEPAADSSPRDRSRVARTGIVRHLDELGRIVIPIEIRKSFGLTEKDPLEISVQDEVIMLSKPQAACVCCGRVGDLAEHRGRAVCRPCITELSRGDY